MNYTLLNAASLILGLAAWISPFVALGTRGRMWQFGMWAAGSFLCCSLALLLQIFYQWRLVEIKDWSAIMDTIGGVALVGSFLVAVTVAINIVCGVLRMKLLRKTSR